MYANAWSENPVEAWKPYSVRWMYSMIVSPIITYGALVWGVRTSMTSVRPQLCKLQRLRGALLSKAGHICQNEQCAIFNNSQR